LRGRTKEELLDGLRRRRAQAAGRASTAAPADGSRENEEPAPLHALLDRFWRSGPELAELHVSPLASEAPDALLRQLGPAPVDEGGRTLVEVLAPAYARLAAAAERRALAD
jgi:uncharacterized Zn finger protein